MNGRRLDPHVLRTIAADIIERTAPETGFLESEWPDLVTSLVRQWLTYGRHATLFPDEKRQYYFTLKRAPLGRYSVDVGKNDSHWSGFVRDWKINPDDLPEILDQLNRGQGAGVVNGDGQELRVYVDPKERKTGVEPLEREELPAPRKPNYEKIANDMVEEQLAGEMDIGLKEELVGSIVAQWRRHQGHACVFMDEGRQLTLKFTERPEGPHVEAKRWARNARPYLLSLGFEAWQVPDVLAQINQGEEVEFEDRRGRRGFLSYNPMVDNFSVRGLSPPQMPSAPARMPPVFCPKCTGVLSPWQADQPRQVCPICGETVGRG